MSGSAAHTLLLATNALLPYSLSAGQMGKRRNVEKAAFRIEI